MRRLPSLILAGLCALSCHINEVSEDWLEIELNDSLKACARLDIALTNLAGTTRLESIWNAPPPDPLFIRHALAQPRPVDFLVRIACLDGTDQATTIKTIPYRGGTQGTVHVVHGPAPRFRIAAFRLLDSADADGDGHFRRYRTVLDVDGNTSMDTLRMSLSYQVQGNPKWFPLIPSRRLPIAGAVTTDTVMQVIEGGARRTISLKAQISTAAGDTLDESLIASIREEAPGQDSAGLRWVFRNHTGAILNLDAEVGADTSVQDRKVDPNDSVVINLASKSPGESITYEAVAQGPGEPLAWDTAMTMEMDRFEVEAEAPPSDTHFVLSIRNLSNQALTAVILNPGTPVEKIYPIEIPGLADKRNLGLFPYVTGTTLAVRRAGGGTWTFNEVEFEVDAVSRFRYADLSIGL